MADKIFLGVSDDLSDTDNWGGALPSAADNVLFRGTRGIVTGLDALSAIALGTVEFDEYFLGPCGNGSEFMQLDCDDLIIRSTSPLIKVDTGTAGAQIRVEKTGPRRPNGTAPVQLIANSATSRVRVHDGIVALGPVSPAPGNTPSAFGPASVFDDVLVGKPGGGGSANVIIGANTTVDNVEVTEGYLEVRGALDDFTVKGGVFVLDTDDDPANGIVRAGIAYLDRFGTITLMTYQGGRTVYNRTSHTRNITDQVYAPADGREPVVEIDSDFVGTSNAPSINSTKGVEIATAEL